MHYFFQLLGWFNKTLSYKICLAYALKKNHSYNNSIPQKSIVIHLHYLMPACTSGSVSTWFTKHVNFGLTQRETVTLNRRHGFLNTGLNVTGELFGACDLIWLEKRALGRPLLLKDFFFPPPPPLIFHLIMFGSAFLSELLKTLSLGYGWMYVYRSISPFLGRKAHHSY